MPKIDLRDFQSLLEEKRSIAPLYTPEWDAADDRDTGVALLKIFTHMQEEIINRLNRVPDKNFTTFLEIIGLKLMPAQPARAPVTFYLPEGLSGGVFVPIGTKVAANETDKHKVLNFETTSGIFVTSAAVEEIYRVDPDNDYIYRYTDDFINKKEFFIFKNKGTKEEPNSTGTDSYPENKQEHILYLGHKELFNLKDSATIELYFNSGTVDAEQFKNFIWEHWGENEELITIDSSIVIPENNILKLTIVKAIGEKEIRGVKTRWIRCRADKVTKSMALPVIKRIQIKVGLDKDKYIGSNIGFFNQIPLDLSKDGRFYIFGQQPRLFDTFYIASREAFSKRNAVIKIIFIRDVDKDKNPDEGSRTLSWEYWNGKIWYALSLKNNKLNDFVSSEVSSDYSGSIEFECPKDIEEIEVNGVKNYWIRVGLAEGDYGHNEYVLIPADDRGTKEHWEVESKFNPPIVNKIDIHYSMNEATDLQVSLLSNNLEYIDLTQESKYGAGLKLFTPLPEKYPTLYIGFKDAFKKGNISIFFSLKDMDYPLESRPEIKWTYWSKAPNLITAGGKDITLVSTEGIDTDTELLFEEKIGSETITGAAIVDSLGSNGKITLKEELNYKYTKDALVFKRTNLEVTDNTEYLTKTGTLEFIGPLGQSKTHKFGIESYWLMGEFIKPGLERLIKGIYPNTVWAEQVETIKDEILGSGDGEKNESYSFFRAPVISPDIWIRYEDIISENEEDTPASEDIKEIKNDTGKIIEKWVRWEIVDDFADSGPRSRHYTIDNAMGTVQFGDGEHGMIPPIGRDNIKATYKTGGGVLGNVAVNMIKTLRSSIAGIDHITNHEPAEGGSDTELLSQIFERGPHLIKHRDRAVTREDFERLAKAASSYIARTKCLIRGNKLTVIVIPKGEEDKPEPSRGLKEVVRKSLLERSLNVIPEESLEIAGPSYKEIKVKVAVIPESIDQAIPLEKMVLKRLKEYLHPLTGGNEGTGWEFERHVHISDIYALLESIKGVDHVEGLKLNNSCEDVSIKECETVCSGEHEVTMRLGS